MHHDTTTQVADRLDRLEAALRERLPLDRFTAPDPIVRTTWPRRLLWTAVGFTAGMVTAYLADPDQGRRRRHELQQRASSTGRDVASSAARRADYTAGEARGAVAETVRRVTPDDVPDDLKTLEARIKSEVFGHRDDVDKVVLRADAPGKVAVKGTVPTPASERELLAEISRVEGVKDVTSELSIASR